MPPERVDDARRRRLLVDRQQLGGRRNARTVTDVAAAMSLLHSTDPSTPYLSVHARADVSPSAIDHAFYEERSLLRHTTIRRTVFAMPLDVAPLAHGAYNVRLIATLRSNLLGWVEASPDTDTAPQAFLERTEADVVQSLRSAGALTGTALAAAVPALRVTFEPMPGAAYSKPMRITSRVLELLAAEGRIARGRPTGRDFTSASWTWEVIDDWLGTAGIATIEPGEALRGLLDRYLAAFGPATVTDIAWWSGLPKGPVRAALADLDATTVELEGVDELGYVRSGDDLDAPDTAGVVALLPGLDSTTMGWKQRAWYVDDRPAAELFDRNGNAGPTVWLDGSVIGAWTQRADGEVVLDVPTDVGADVRTALDAEAERTASWLGEVRVKWRYPTPLTKRLSGG